MNKAVKVRMNEKGLPEPQVLRRHRPQQADAQSNRVPYADTEEQYSPQTDDLPAHPSWLRSHLLHIGVGMLSMLAIWYMLSTYVAPFVSTTLNHWDCGDARVCVYTLDVGHGGMSTFLTQYNDSQVVLIEIPHGDVSHAQTYRALDIMKGDTQKHVIDLKTAYISRHPKPGKPDVLASVSGFVLPVVFYNTGNSFTTEEPNG